MHGRNTSLQGAAHCRSADGSAGVNVDFDLSMRDAIAEYLRKVQVIHKGVAGMLSACEHSVVGDSDFNCSETTSKESDELCGLVAGNAIMRELIQPQRNKYGMNILFGSRRNEDSTSTSNTPRIQSLSWQTLLLISTEEKSVERSTGPR